VTFDGDFPFLQ